MFGTLRLFLALCVLVSHMPLHFAFGFIPGPAAVVVFYSLSGFVVEALLQRIDLRHGTPLLGFYPERFLRIYPQFAFHSIVGLVLMAFGIVGAATSDSIIAKMAVRPDIMLSNFLLLPLQMKQFWGDLKQTMYVPVAWSLALEMCFYALWPWLRKSFFLYAPATLASMAVALVAVAGQIHTHSWSYALFPGTFHLFVIGSLLYRRKAEPLILAGWTLYCVGLSYLATQAGTWHRPHLQEVAVGSAAAPLLIVLLRNLPRPKWDEFFGRLSYPVFLNHFSVLWVTRYIWPDLSPWITTLVVICVSLPFVYLTYALIEKPLDDFRRATRKLGKPDTSALPTVDPSQL